MSALSRFDVMLAESREVRPALGVDRSRLPRSFTWERVLGYGSRDDFVPALEAAATMGTTLAEVEGLAAAGLLDATYRADGLWVRPVVLSRLRVRDPRVPEPVVEQPATAVSESSSPPAGTLPSFGLVERERS